MFDSPRFSGSLFFPRDDASPPPPGARDWYVDVDDHRARLHVRHHGAAARATVLLFHGNGEVVADYDRLAEPFAAAGAALVVVDYRGYGLSTGGPTLRNAMLDAHVVLASVEAAIEGPLVVMGRSLGSACANELYGAAPAGVAAFVLESGFTDLAALVRRRGLEPPARLAAADEATFDPVPKLRRGHHPLLVLHGRDDTLISPHEAERAYASAGTADKRLVLIDGHGHNDLGHAPAYWWALRTFVDHVVDDAPATT